MGTSENTEDYDKEDTASFQLEISPSQLQVYSTETRIEEELRDGTRLVRTISNELTLRRSRSFKVSLLLPRWVILLILILIAILIGLIAVGPHEVWEWLTRTIDKLIR